VDALTSKLDFDPGLRFAYSNTGYAILGLVVEAASGKSFREYVSQVLLEPSIGKPYRLGQSLNSAPGEAVYYPADPGRGPPAPGVPRTLTGRPTPYGTYHVENMEAVGGWVATPAEVLDFFLAIDGRKGQALLKGGSIDQMLAKPSFELAKSSRYYGLGVQVTQSGNGQRNWWHAGSQPGVQTLALRTAQGLSWVAAFNGRPQDNNGAPGPFLQSVDRALWRAARSLAG